LLSPSECLALNISTPHHPQSLQLAAIGRTSLYLRNQDYQNATLRLATNSRLDAF
jgi:hypothetical protein